MRRANPRLTAGLGQQQLERRLAMLAPPIVWNLTLPLLDAHLGGKEGLLARLVNLYAADSGPKGCAPTARTLSPSAAPGDAP